MKLARGDVVVVYLPFSSGAGGKARPALVVQEDRRNAAGLDVVVAVITKSTKRVGSDLTHVLVDPASVAGQASGLIHPSVIKCGHLITVEQSLVRHAIGHLPNEVMENVNSALKLALGLV